MSENDMQLTKAVNPGALSKLATDVAGLCREIVIRTAVVIQGKKYVRVEGWESIATTHGCIPGADKAVRAYDEDGNHIGYEAQGILRNMHGEIVATATGFVGFDEQDRKGNPTWKNRDEYAGRAMAQTRAISRVCRSAFAHVIVLMDAGLSTTPAEEVPADGFDNARPVHEVKVEPAPPLKPRDRDKGFDELPMDDTQDRPMPVDDEWWKEVVCPIPPQGTPRHEYILNPITLGQMSESNNSRFFGFCANYVPREYNGKISDGDMEFAKALDSACGYCGIQSPPERTKIINGI